MESFQELRSDHNPTKFNTQIKILESPPLPYKIFRFNNLHSVSRQHCCSALSSRVSRKNDIEHLITNITNEIKDPANRATIKNNAKEFYKFNLHVCN